MAEETKYRVLARKYRPQVFKDLIGQDALVRTISNAIAQNKLAQAYILTGIRGVGKTSSARIIARAFNCVGPDGNGGMTPNPCGVCKHCKDIANDCHIDVIEMDAASNTGVDNIREIIEGARYNPLSARYKIYIIDEVHMLSKSAFNALLKILEEPPERVKFIFATTEIRKVPVTILSRCQRFDLKRIDSAMLATYFKEVATKENVTFEDSALALIAKAADGSVRDGLSLLDQAIAHGNGHISEEQVRQMIGLADKTTLFELYELLMKGDMPAVLQTVQTQYNLGTDPLTLLTDLMDLTHWLTQIKITPNVLKNDILSENEKNAGKKLSENLSISTLSRTWQMLLKGFSEVKFSESPIKALEMLLIRIAYASDLPSPIELVQQIKNGEINIPLAQKKTKELAIPQQTLSVEKQEDNRPHPKEQAQTQNAPAPKTLQEIVDLAQNKGQRLLAFNLSTYVHPIEVSFGKLHFSAPSDMPKAILQELRNFLLAETKIEWDIALSEQQGGQTLKEQRNEKQQQIKNKLSETPLVSAVLKTFPGAKVETFRMLEKNNTDATELSDETIEINEQIDE
ncbi:MAG: DNA polymerase III subunit gamma/tau [Alphaproteobacteria bacterium]|nr:DNA polymerase III subunit gamma/tau [Alphaproteobacteria bacterium]